MCVIILKHGLFDSLKFGIGEIGFGEIGFGEIGIGEISIGEIDIGEIRKIESWGL